VYFCIMKPNKTKFLLLSILTAAVILGIVVLVVFIISLFTECGSNKNKKLTAADTIAVANNLPVDTALQSRLKEFSLRPRPNGKFAFMVYDITAQKPVYGCNEDMAMSSASCMKLLSGIAGLHLMGCNYIYYTTMFMRGKVAADGCLNGDVAFSGGLNPQLQPVDLNDFAKALSQKGVKKIGGKMIVDLVAKQPVQSEAHWYPWDLSFSKYGLLYKGDTRIIAALKSALRSQGIAVKDSQIVQAPTPKGMTAVHSDTLAIDEVVKKMWKNSSNTQATAMLYTIGHRVDPKQHPATAGVAYLRRFLHDEVGMTHKSLVIHDGCGLCTHNHLSPRALTAVLDYGYRNPDIREALERNLSVSGTDGTLKREMTGPKTRGKIKAKTGTLSHPYGISSLAGICDGTDGHKLAFAIMDCEMSVLDARVLQRKLCEALVAK